MPKAPRVHALGAGLLAAAALAVAVGPASSASYVDERANTCHAEAGNPCLYGMVVTYWHRAGSRQRTLSWIYANRSPVRSHNLARWWYQTPGGPRHVGGSWRAGKAVESWTEISWGRGRHDRVGPDLPAGSRICVEFNYGATTKPCITLK
ncbi:hypothetical protein [Streptomyces sp. NPDC001828]|uniref:hypothetical protein n=1 Tax=Streptomyces sp. NPDC001828 TaxID=3364615 RepID=UPI0036746588